MNRIYGMMLSNTDDMFQEELWSNLSSYIASQNDRIFYFCGKPLEKESSFESNPNIIFNLMKYLPMDGMLSLTGTLGLNITRQEYNTFLKPFENIPTVSLSIPLENCKNVTLDNYISSFRITEHLLFHGYENIGYITGPLSTQESLDRRDGAIAALKTENKTFIKICEGDFSSGSGYEHALVLLDEKVDAIICGNDQMALGVYKAAKERGLKIPDDLAVIGFDDIESANLISPTLTTVQQPFMDMAKSAFDLLSSDTQDDVKYEGVIKIRESCGCKMLQKECTDEFYEKQYYKRKYHKTITDYDDILLMSSQFNQVTNLETLRLALTSYFQIVKNADFYLSLFNDYKMEIQNPSTFVYPEQMNLFFGYTNGIITQDQVYRTFDGLPQPIFRMTQFNAFLVYPIIVLNLTYGYIVVDAVTAQNRSFIALRTIIGNVLNRIDMIGQLETFNKNMAQLASRDSMTKLFNRRGFYLNVESEFDLALMNAQTPCVAFCDINGLKKINDHFGHAYGDLLITETSSLLNEVFDKHIIARFGGDEFVIYIKHATPDIIKTLNSKLQLALSNKNLNSDYPFKISLEIGFAFFDPSQHKSIEDLINAADHKLYALKRSGN